MIIKTTEDDYINLDNIKNFNIKSAPAYDVTDKFLKKTGINFVLEDIAPKECVNNEIFLINTPIPDGIDFEKLDAEKIVVNIKLFIEKHIKERRSICYMIEFDYKRNFYKDSEYTSDCNLNRTITSGVL